MRVLMIESDEKLAGFLRRAIARVTAT